MAQIRTVKIQIAPVGDSCSRCDHLTFTRSGLEILQWKCRAFDEPLYNGRHVPIGGLPLPIRCKACVDAEVSDGG